MAGFNENNFARRADDELDKRSMMEKEHPVIRQMHQVATGILTEAAFKLEDFADTHSEERRQKDQMKLEDRKRKFAESLKEKNISEDNMKRASDVFEALVFQYAELGNWLGQNAETIKTSEFDDVINGVDLIVQFTDEGTSRHLGLGVDVTYGTRSIYKKFNRIKTEIDNDKLAQVEYFESHNYKGRLKQLPRIVIGVEIETVISLAALWMRIRDNDPKKGELKTQLSNHFVQHILVQEVIMQLETFLKYAEENNKSNAARSYREALATIKNVNLNVELPTDSETKQAIENDKVFLDIKKQLISFGQMKTFHDKEYVTEEETGEPKVA